MSTLENEWKAKEKATGISQQEWLEVLEPLQDDDHSRIAEVALEKLQSKAQVPGSVLDGKNLPWWAQSVAITFEQHIGRRQTHQRCDGSFGASGSKTVNADLETVATDWARFAEEQIPGLAGDLWEGEPRITGSEKWRYWRCDLLNGATVSVNMNAKNTEKSVVAFEVKKLNSPEQSSEFKASIKEALAAFVAWRSERG